MVAGSGVNTRPGADGNPLTVNNATAVLYSPSYNLFAQADMLVEFGPTGAVRSSYGGRSTI